MTHYNRKTYRIDDIDFDVNPSAIFTRKSKTSDGIEVELEESYKEYYESRYGINLTETEMLQPLLVSHPRKKDINKGLKSNIILLPSLANLTGLSDDMRKDFRLMQSLSTHLHMDPVNRKKKLDEFMHKLKTTPQVRCEFTCLGKYMILRDMVWYGSSLIISDYLGCGRVQVVGCRILGRIHPRPCP